MERKLHLKRSWRIMGSEGSSTLPSDSDPQGFSTLYSKAKCYDLRPNAFVCTHDADLFRLLLREKGVLSPRLFESQAFRSVCLTDPPAVSASFRRTGSQAKIAL